MLNFSLGRIFEFLTSGFVAERNRFSTVEISTDEGFYTNKSIVLMLQRVNSKRFDNEDIERLERLVRINRPAD